MKPLKLFNHYMSKYWAELIHEDWHIEIVTLNRSYIDFDQLENIITPEHEKVRCIVFFSLHEEGIEINMLQNDTGSTNLAIVFMKRGELVHAVTAESVISSPFPDGHINSHLEAN
ncbi:MAG: hypothetical protein LPK26_13020 [Bacillaceae bacterium]|nr:hypothetical protein [Bacillaceae bacterium]